MTEPIMVRKGNEKWIKLKSKNWSWSIRIDTRREFLYFHFTVFPSTITRCRRYQMKLSRLIAATATLLALTFSVSLAQLTVHGTVTDQTGTRLAGANILEKGT